MKVERFKLGGGQPLQEGDYLFYVREVQVLFNENDPYGVGITFEVLSPDEFKGKTYKQNFFVFPKNESIKMPTFDAIILSAIIGVTKTDVKPEFIQQVPQVAHLFNASAEEWAREIFGKKDATSEKILKQAIYLLIGGLLWAKLQKNKKGYLRIVEVWQASKEDEKKMFEGIPF